MRVRVKICGLRSPDEARFAAVGADAVGAVVAVPRSPRNLDPARAAELFAAVPAGVLRAAVTVSTEPRVLHDLLSLGPEILQLHVELPPRRWGEIRALVGERALIWGLLGVRVEEPEEALLRRARALRGAPLDGVILDTVARGRAGGTGTAHDWGRSRLARDILYPTPVVLAGGLTPENVAAAIRAVEPDWVDVSSGVEEGGRKSPAKIARFVEAVRHAAE
ncbi:MAG: phosphoribosylanthranilate isomerase [Caldiserica bacterium]|nr:phosphoribosylanthranilate isomerase [Caldisericota bacterium]